MLPCAVLCESLSHLLRQFIILLWVNVIWHSVQHTFGKKFRPQIYHEKFWPCVILSLAQGVEVVHGFGRYTEGDSVWLREWSSEDPGSFTLAESGSVDYVFALHFILRHTGWSLRSHRNKEIWNSAHKFGPCFPKQTVHFIGFWPGELQVSWNSWSCPPYERMETGLFLSDHRCIHISVPSLPSAFKMVIIQEQSVAWDFNVWHRCGKSPSVFTCLSVCLTVCLIIIC